MGHSKSKEIERKFLIKDMPKDLQKYTCEDIVQGYVAITQDGTEVRLRKRGDEYFQTIKRGAGKIRTELEIGINKEQFNTLWPITAGKRIEKTRYKIPHKNGLIELDVYRGNLSGLVVAEIEFDSEKSSNKFKVSEWFGREVTLDKEYKNQGLMLNGIPKSYQKLK